MKFQRKNASLTKISLNFHRNLTSVVLTAIMKTLALAANGEGYGHASRLVSLVPYLRESYRLILYAPPSIHGFIREKLPFLDAWNIPIRIIPWLHMAKVQGKIAYVQTFRENLPTLLKSRTLIQRLRNQMIHDSIDVCVSDFEPYSAWAASSLGIPILQINHPAIVLRSPSITPEALIAKAIANLMMGPYDKKILVSYFDGDLGPMIRPELTRVPVTNDGSLVVYVKPGYRKPILHVLESLNIDNVHLFPDKDKDYTKHLAACKAIIAGGGHQTMSEALYLGKPILAIPQCAQYEQQLNSFVLEASGYGMQTSLNKLGKRLPEFLHQIDHGGFPRTKRIPWVPIHTTDNTERVVKKIRTFSDTHSRMYQPSLSRLLLANWIEAQRAGA